MTTIVAEIALVGIVSVLVLKAIAHAREREEMVKASNLLFAQRQSAEMSLLALNSERWNECQRAEDHHWHRRSQLDRAKANRLNRIYFYKYGRSIPATLTLARFEMRKFRAVMICADHLQFFTPDLPRIETWEEFYEYYSRILDLPLHLMNFKG